MGYGYYGSGGNTVRYADINQMANIYGYKKTLQILLGNGVRINSAQKCEERETRTYSGPNGESYHVCPGEYRPE